MEEIKSLEDLLDLMDIDLKIGKLLDRRSSLPELNEYKTVHEDVERIGTMKEDAQGALRDADRELSRTNGELEIVAERAASDSGASTDGR